MNFTTVFQIFTLILLEICRTKVKVVSASCQKIVPSDVDKVDILVYINGDTQYDLKWYGQYCSWRDAGFPFDQYAPVTVKVGGDVRCNNNDCKCPNEESDQVGCTVTFQHVCAERILGQDDFKNLLCCAGQSDGFESKGFQQCVKERGDLGRKIADCMKQEGPDSPKNIALRHAKEVTDIVNLQDYNTEPFFFYNKLFDKCISSASPTTFLEQICLMLKSGIAESITQCMQLVGS